MGICAKVYGKGAIHTIFIKIFVENDDFGVPCQTNVRR